MNKFIISIRFIESEEVNELCAECEYLDVHYVFYNA